MQKYGNYCLERPIQEQIISFNPFANNKLLEWFKLKAFADDKLNMAQKLKFVLGRIENIEGKGENDGYQHFLLLPQCFQKASSTGSLKVGIMWDLNMNKFNPLPNNKILDVTKLKAFADDILNIAKKINFSLE